MAIGLDTSVVVRMLIGVPQLQANRARARVELALEQGEQILVCDLVIAEAYFALHYHYGVPKDEARNLLLRFAESGVVTVEPREALVALKAHRGAGLVDRLVHARYRQTGAVTLTFERKQAALEGAVRLR